MFRIARVLATISLCWTAPAAAQYFGQNNVQYRHLDFAVIETEHFDIHYHEGERAAALDAARMAERAYARLSRILNHEYRERQPIILFASHTQFQQNNINPVGEGTGGFTEFFRHRVLLPFTGSYKEFEHVLQHEIAHQFQIDIFARGRVGGGISRIIAVNPPLWFMEGMAEYLSLGPISPETAVWLRDAALDWGLPSLEQLTWDPQYFPYRFGHALWSYVGERWGDEAVGEILHATAASGVEGAFRRMLGISLEDLIEEWHDAIQRTYLPQVAELQQARQLARPVLTQQRSSGTVHIAPSLSPDGQEIVYLSEGNSYFIDLYLADAETGRIKRRLIRSAFSSDFESLRFLNSVGAWSPDGGLFAFAAKRGGRDDLVIFDLRNDRVERRIRAELDGIATPSWSPDGSQLVFTGFVGGLSDLFLVNADGTNLRRLTHDKYADLHPSWSPSGDAIAFATDRGTATDLDALQLGPLGIALYDPTDQSIEVLPGMSGNNMNPQWAPDGRSVAFVSDRTGIPNVFLYDLGEHETYQLTDVYTGVLGITPLSPVISWAPLADRLVFTYFEKGDFNVYGIDNPRSLKREPWDPNGPRPVVASLLSTPTDETAGSDVREGVRYAAAPGAAADTTPQRREAANPPAAGATYYRRGSELRQAARVAAVPDSLAPPTISVRALLDSQALAVPDSFDFSFRDYSAKLSPDYVVQPTIGYVRDNFGSGVFGGTAISLSDMLASHRVLIAGQVNGRIDEAQVLALYANLSRRVNWAVGVSQTPYFFYTGTAFTSDTLGRPVLSTVLERFVVREAFVEAARPFNRFRRLEFGIRAANVSRAWAIVNDAFDPNTGVIYDRDIERVGLPGANYIRPSVALVFDNSISLWTGPFFGRRSRFEYSPSFGDWQYHQLLGDYRRYDNLLGPFTLASRLLFFGRFGRDDDQFPLFLGTPELLRGYTAGSLRKNECRTDATGSYSGCGAIDQLIGSRIAVLNAELRFPLFRNFALGFAPIGFPPIEGAIFFDAGLAWRDGVEVVLNRDPDANKDLVRQPLMSWGVSVRANLLGFLILRADYAKPLSREQQGSYWTLSLGPTF